MIIRTYHKGFTILETLIYIGLFSVLMSGMLVAVYELLAGGTENRVSVAIQEEGTFINRKISWALSGATAVSVPNAHTLTVTRPDLGAQSPLLITENSGLMRIARGSGAPASLATSAFTVANTIFALIPPAGGMPTGVSASYTIDGVPFTFKTYLRF